MFSPISSPVPTNVIIFLKSRGFFQEIFSIGFELKVVCIRNDFKALAEPFLRKGPI